MNMRVTVRSATMEDLADRFAVSRMTILRDPSDRARAGLLRKIRGGAAIEAGTRFEGNFWLRGMHDAGSKRRRSQVAAALVEPGMT